MTTPLHPLQPLLADVRQLIDAARQRVAQTVNAELTQLYWQIGRRISTELLHGQRADYGKQVMAALARQLTTDFGKGWSEQQLRHCVRLVEVFAQESILSTLRRELTWSHLKTLIYIDDPLKRDFYLEICRVEHWSVRQLQERINSLLFERTAISKKPEETIRQDLVLLRDQGRLSPDLTFRDPYVLDFLGLSDSYSERDLESAIIAEMQRFIIELGSDFAFLARQKRITITGTGYVGLSKAADAVVNYWLTTAADGKSDREVLTHADHISAEAAKQKASCELRYRYPTLKRSEPCMHIEPTLSLPIQTARF